jgi:hypothetical protein
MPGISWRLGHRIEMTYSVDSDVGVVVVYVERSWRRHTYQDPHYKEEDGCRQGDLALYKVHLCALAPHGQ